MKKLFAMLLALVMSISMLTLAVFAEPSTEEEEDVNVPAVEEENPETGLALAVIPAVVAAAAVALSKKR